MYLSCPATTSFPAILRGKLSNVLYFIQSKVNNKVVVVVVVNTTPHNFKSMSRTFSGSNRKKK